MNILTLTILYIVITAQLFSATWIIYVAIMYCKNNWDDLPLPAKVLASMWLPVGLILDVILNILMTVYFLDFFILDWTLSNRLNRIRDTKTGYRLRHADYICENLLNPFDKGHC